MTIDVSNLFAAIAAKPSVVKVNKPRAPKITTEIEELATALFDKAEELFAETGSYESAPFPWALAANWKTVSYALRGLSEEKVILASAGTRNGKGVTQVNGVEVPLVKLTNARHPNRKPKA